MNRTPELQPLSRDRHQALYAALKLRRADAETAGDAAAHFGTFWRENGERRFEIEERVLLPGFARAGGGPRSELVAHVLTDHVEIRARAAELDPSEPSALNERAAAESG